MTQREIKKIYIRDMYDGDRKAYLRDRRQDYCKAQFRWTCWMDAMCKNGVITQKQWDRATF